MEDQIVEGIASILWGLAWGDHAEETSCTNLSGCEITGIMPEIGPKAYTEAWRIVGATEQCSGSTLISILYACLRADGLDPEQCASEHAERFGNCVAYAALGHGVSWFDDHAPCDRLQVPDTCVDLWTEVADACEAEHENTEDLAD